MGRSYADFLVNNVEISSQEATIGLISIFAVIGLIPFTIFIISNWLLRITKWTFFKRLNQWFLKVFTHGIIEHIFISTIKYIHTNKGYIHAREISKDQSVNRMKGIIFTKTNAKRIRHSAALLFPFQAYILTLVIVDQLFIPVYSNVTCETYQEMNDTNPAFAVGCSLTPKSVVNISNSEFFNPLNAFRSEHDIVKMNLSSFCKNSSHVQNETLLTNYYIQCTKYVYRWNNIINTLTNALQWHQITIFIIKTNLFLTYSWQTALGHSHCWLKLRRIYRILLLILFLLISTSIFLVYTLIMVAFNKALKSLHVVLTFQASAILLIPMLVVPLLFFNVLALTNWTICTLRNKKCEQEVSRTYHKYRNVSIYAEDNQIP